MTWCIHYVSFITFHHHLAKTSMKDWLKDHFRVPLSVVITSAKELFICQCQPVLPTPQFTHRIVLYFEIACHRSKTCWAGGLFHPSARGSPFFFKFASFLSIQRVFEPFQCPRTFFSSISGIKMSWRAINIDYPLHVEINNLIVFFTQLGDFYYFAAEKHPNLGNLAYLILLDKNWATLKSLAAGKKANLLRLGDLKFCQHWCQPCRQADFDLLFSENCFYEKRRRSWKSWLCSDR